MSFNAIITADVKGLETGVDKALQAIGNLAKTAREKVVDIGKSFGNVGQAIENLAKTAREKIADIVKSFEKIADIGKSFENAGKKASILSAALIAAGGASFKMAADFQDAMGATDQIYKESSKAVKDWADSLPSMYGVAKSEALEYANLMGSMLTNIGGLTEEQAAKQSASLIELAGDLSAMFGGSTESAVKALTGALKGNNSMLDNYGMAVTESLVKARAFELGLAKQGEELSSNAKQAATLSLIYEQTGAAQGQAAREADGASGSIRALGAEMKNLSIEMGEILLPIITPLINKVKEWAENFRELSPETKKIIVVVGLVVAAIGPLLLILGKIISLAPLVGSAITAMTGPIGITVLAIAAAVAAIVYYWDDIKAYFTTGGGSKTFDSISALATKLKDQVINLFTKISEVVTKVWDRFGGYITGAFSAAFDNIMAVVDFFVTFIGNVADFFSAIIDGDFSGALDALENLFVDAFNGIMRIVTNVISGAANVVVGFLDAIGLEGWAEKTKSFANSMALAYQPVAEQQEELAQAIEKTAQAQEKTSKQASKTSKELTEAAASAVELLSVYERMIGANVGVKEATDRTRHAIGLLNIELEGLRSGEIFSKNVIEDITAVSTKIKELNSQLEILTGGKEEIAVPEMMERKGLGVEALVLDATVLPSVNSDAYKESLEEIAAVTLDLGGIISNGVASFAASIGEAFADGNFEGLGAGLLGVMADMVGQLGQMLITAGIGMINLAALITNPFTAIAAGIAMVALASAAGASVKKTISKTTGGGGSMGGTNSYNQTSKLGDSSYRGAYKDDWNNEVVFKIGNNELVGTLDKANNRRERL